MCLCICFDCSLCLHAFAFDFLSSCVPRAMFQNSHRNFWLCGETSGSYSTKLPGEKERGEEKKPPALTRVEAVK